MQKNGKALFSTKVSAGSRTYFFDVKEASNGACYLVISESRRTGEDTYQRSRLMVFADHVKDFQEALEKSAKVIIE
jgi:hypothetical protein